MVRPWVHIVRVGDITGRHVQKSKISLNIGKCHHLHNETENGRHGVSDPVELLNGANFCLQNDLCRKGKKWRFVIDKKIGYGQGLRRSWTLNWCPNFDCVLENCFFRITFSRKIIFCNRKSGEFSHRNRDYCPSKPSCKSMPPAKLERHTPTRSSWSGRSTTSHNGTRTCRPTSPGRCQSPNTR